MRSLKSYLGGVFMIMLGLILFSNFAFAQDPSQTCEPGSKMCNGVWVYTCNATGGMWVVTDYCGRYGQVCSNGQCVDPCTSQCELDSQQCSGTGYQTCADYNSDGCTEWSDVTSCPSGQECSNGACMLTCSNECSASSQTQCSGTSGYQTCGNYDSDSCLEWSTVTNCVTGQVCQSGNCVSSCTNQCTSGAKQCSGFFGYKTCGDYNSDGCTEWSTIAGCPSGQSCSNGVCTSSCSNECSTSGQKQCSGTAGYQTCGNYDSDSCLEWSPITNCATGLVCSAGNCVSTCTPKTCSGLGYNCGSWSNGCGVTLNCGNCSSGYTCSSGKCVANIPATCSDGKLSTGETDIDCGGTKCSKCADFNKCLVNTDCVNSNCRNKVCDPKECGSQSALSNASLADIVKTFPGTGVISQTKENIRVNAYAVAKAESSGNPSTCDDLNIPSKGNLSIGLWQVNTAVHSEYIRSSLFDPVNNSLAAVAISSQGLDWTPWCTWETLACNGKGNNAYRSYLNEARTALCANPQIVFDSATLTKNPMPAYNYTEGIKAVPQKCIGNACLLKIEVYTSGSLTSTYYYTYFQDSTGTWISSYGASTKRTGKNGDTTSSDVAGVGSSLYLRDDFKYGPTNETNSLKWDFIDLSSTSNMKVYVCN